MSLINPTKVSLKQIITALVVAIILAAVGYHFWTKNNLNKQIEVEKQARSDEAQERIDESKTEVNRASENVNAVKNANYSNLNNDELRQRIINAARGQR